MKKDSLQFHQYTLTTNIYAADLPVHAPKHLVPVLTEAYTKTIAKDKSIVVKLMYWIEQHPDVPQFQNYLSLYYALNGDSKKAFEVNNRLLKQFPEYLYARLNLADFYLDNNEPEKVPEVLGITTELQNLYAERKIFHHEEYLNFYQTAGQYYCAINELEKAEAILANLHEVSDLLDADTTFEKLENHILAARFKNINFNNVEKSDDAVVKEKPTLPQTKKPPAFHYPQISWLYQYSITNIGEERIYELLSLNKEWLRIDLETVVYDAIRRYNFFEQSDYDDNEADFCLHAVYLLKEINAEESLEVLFKLLRQPEDLLDFWLGEMLTDNLWQVIYTLGLNHANKLIEFLKEPFNYTFARSEVSVALTQMILHHHEKREEIISLYKNLISFFISNKADKSIVNNTFNSLMAGDIIEFNGKELLPEIKLLFEEDMVDESMNGDMNEVINQLNETPDDDSYKKQLQTYFEIAAELKSWEEDDEEAGINNEIDIDEEDTKEYYDDWEEIAADDTNYFYSGATPFVRTAPKVGRNEPCPCGSGKKFKKCCGINEKD